MSASPELFIQNRQRSIPINLGKLRDFANSALARVLGLPTNSNDVLAGLGEVSIALISDKTMARFHSTFMNIEGPTDVLTFEHGEILISAETAAQYAEEYGHTTQQEVALYILHGLLHLRGYNDKASIDREEMHRVQSEIFSRFRFC